MVIANGCGPGTNSTGNRIATNYFATGGACGPVAYFDSSGTGNAWSASGAAIPSP